MNDSYYFRTSDPDYIRHAPSMLEILSKAFPTSPLLLPSRKVSMNCSVLTIY